MTPGSREHLTPLLKPGLTQPLLCADIMAKDGKVALWLQSLSGSGVIHVLGRYLYEVADAVSKAEV